MLFVENSFKLRVRSNLAQYDHAVVVVGDEFCAVHRDVWDGPGMLGQNPQTAWMVDVYHFAPFTGVEGLVQVPESQKSVLAAHDYHSSKERGVENFGLVAEAFQATIGLQVINV